MAIDRYLIVRGGALYVAAVTTLAIWGWRRPTGRAWGAALVASMWNIPAVLLVNVVALRVGWWSFDAAGGLLLGVPVDLLFAWAWMWGALPALAFPTAPLAVVVAIAFAVDLALMPAAAPVVRLESTWFWGELAALVAVLVPAQLLARWTIRDERLPGRAVLQMMGFTGVIGFWIPAMAIQASGGRWVNPLTRPAWQASLIVQALAIAALAGLTAVQEFVTRGGGTAVPFDPPRRLVTSGIYAYVRNPMQIAGVLFLVLLGLVLENLWVSAAGVMAHMYSIGLAGWDEEADLRRRFGDAWTTYRRAVPRWLPRLRPWHDHDSRPSRLYVSETCGVCSEVARWFRSHRPIGLAIVAAEAHPSGALRRITYEPLDGAPAASGIEAIARGLEHLHFGWAVAGFALRLPIVCPIVQLIVDASGGAPRTIPTRVAAVGDARSAPCEIAAPATGARAPASPTR
jgi:protein-S-isoprenylcysteine O-methyltransferase Ste14